MSYEEAISDFRDSVFDIISASVGHKRIYPARTNFVKPDKDYVTYQIVSSTPLDGAGYFYGDIPDIEKTYMHYEIAVRFISVNPDMFGEPCLTYGTCGDIRHGLSELELVYNHLTLNNIGYLRSTPISDSSALIEGSQWEERASFISYFHVVIEESDDYLNGEIGTIRVNLSVDGDSSNITVGEIVTGNLTITDTYDIISTSGTVTGNTTTSGSVLVYETLDLFSSSGIVVSPEPLIPFTGAASYDWYFGSYTQDLSAVTDSNPSTGLKLQPPFPDNINDTTFGVNLDGIYNVTRIEIDHGTGPEFDIGTGPDVKLRVHGLTSNPDTGSTVTINIGDSVYDSGEFIKTGAYQTTVLNVGGVNMQGVGIFADFSDVSSGPYIQLSEIRVYGTAV